MYIQQQEDKITIKAIFTFSDFPTLIKIVKELERQNLEDLQKNADANKIVVPELLNK